MSKTSKRIIVYIDGENFVHRAVDLLGWRATRDDLIGLNLKRLIMDLTGQKKTVEIKYYTTRTRFAGVSTKNHARLQAVVNFNSQWLSRLGSQGVEIIRAGILRAREAKPCPKCGNILDRFVEKGVDVRLAVDMIEDAKDPSVEKIYIVSSDLDLLPAIQVVKKHKKKMIYVASAEAVNGALVATIPETLTFTKRNIEDVKYYGQA